MAGRAEVQPADLAGAMDRFVVRADDANLIALFERDRPVHPYALGDLDLFAPLSTWWLRGDAAIGRLELVPGDPAIVYAVSVADPTGTLDLLEDLARGPLRPPFVATGPIGMAARMADLGLRVEWSSGCEKYWLEAPHRVTAPPRPPSTLGPEHVESLTALYTRCLGPSWYFVPELVTEGRYLGYLHEGQVVAAAGTHVLSQRMKVAAIGNVATAPEFRGQGLASDLMRALVAQLRPSISTFGLNVQGHNPGARRIYERLGFVRVAAYEEGRFSQG
jgi:GNAT superfamily N-acetyltransferase